MPWIFADCKDIIFANGFYVEYDKFGENNKKFYWIFFKLSEKWYEHMSDAFANVGDR